MKATGTRRAIRHLICGAIAVIALDANGQATPVPCGPLVVIPGPGGGGLTTGAITAPGTQVPLSANDCFQAGATYLWTPSGVTTSGATVASPAAGISATHTLRSTTASVTKSGSLTITGARAGAPICSLTASTTTPTVGQTFTLSVSCTPAATSYSWSTSDSDTTLVSGQNSPTAIYKPLTATATGVTRALYMTPSNTAGFGPIVAVGFKASAAVATPTVPSLAPQVSAGTYHACGLALGGAVKCWGRNDFGQLGNAATAQRSLPVDVSGLASGVAAISSGAFHTCALPATGGGATCWGNNGNGALGNNGAGISSVPVNVFGFPGNFGSFTAIASGYEHSCAIASTSNVWCWGLNDAGQLGTQTPTTPYPSPVGAVASPGVGAVSVGPLTNIAALSLGQPFSCALTTGGGVKCWGDNAFGELGNGSTVATSPPVDVTGLASGQTAISAGSFHACALDTVGLVRCWGRNGNGQLGDGTTADRRTPVRLSVQATDATAIAAGGKHTCALLSNRSVVCWGDNTAGQLGDGTTTSRLTPVTVGGLPSSIVAISAGLLFSAALASDGAVYEWGDNSFGQVGDGSLFPRIAPRAVVGGSGTGYLGLRNTQPTVPPQQAPAIPVAVSGTVVPGGSANVTATITPRPQDVGANLNVYAFGLAPAALAKKMGVPNIEPTLIHAKDGGGKAAGDLCALVQLTGSGQLTGIPSISQLTPFLGNTLSAAGASFNLLNNVATVTIAGTTICLGYGTSPAAMQANGTSQCVLTVPGNVVCNPQAPQTGWWWNPAEAGRGFSLEIQGGNAFFASYLYDTSGRATWLASTGPATLEGSLFSGRLLSLRSGQTLTGAPRAPDPAVDSGAITLAFTDASHGTLVWPGGTIPIERFNIVANGLAAPAVTGQPERGWWWNAAEPGRGFFLEWQGASAFVAGYMYDAGGNPLWYASFLTTPNPLVGSGAWTQFANGQTLTGAYRQATPVNASAGALGLQFQGATSGTMTLPDGRQIPITRFRF